MASQHQLALNDFAGRDGAMRVLLGLARVNRLKFTEGIQSGAKLDGSRVDFVQGQRGGGHPQAVQVRTLFRQAINQLAQGVDKRNVHRMRCIQAFRALAPACWAWYQARGGCPSCSTAAASTSL